MNMNESRSEAAGTGGLREQAAHWWVRLHAEDASPQDDRAFGAWAMRSPEHIREFVQMARLLSALESSAMSWPDVSRETLIREAVNDETHVTPIDNARDDWRGASRPWRQSEPRSRLSRLGLGLAVAASLVVAVGVWLAFPQGARFETTLGEQRTVQLEDGSRVVLNTQSAIEVRFGSRRRYIHLLRGEALFEVAHDAARPFDVDDDRAIVRAVGTAFNVDRRAGHTTLTVVEGTVAVVTQARVLVHAAERVVITEAGSGEPEKVSDVSAVTAWTHDRLEFDRRPLGEVAEELNRYNQRKIVIHDDALAHMEVTGVFRATDVQAFMTFLARAPGVRIEETSGGGYLVARSP